jgi:hypothetical protein
MRTIPLSSASISGMRSSLNSDRLSLSIGLFKTGTPLQNPTNPGYPQIVSSRTGRIKEEPKNFPSKHSNGVDTPETWTQPETHVIARWRIFYFLLRPPFAKSPVLSVAPCPVSAASQRYHLHPGLELVVNAPTSASA